jgi:hypothetical protein
MEPNEETLSTRDLASPNEAVGVPAAADDAGNGAVPEEHEQRSQESRLPSDEDPQRAGSERMGTPAGEQTQVPSTPQTPAEGGTEASGRDQTVGAAQPDASLRTEGRGAGGERDDRLAESGQARDTRERDGGSAQPSTDAEVSTSDAGGSLLPAEMDATFQQRWKEIQTRFVDEPRGAVEDADSLVANLMQQLAESFAKERERLEAQWGRGEDISTEDLRVALQRYRTFFQRLLST